jgi:hypothetical protein
MAILIGNELKLLTRDFSIDAKVFSSYFIFTAPVNNAAVITSVHIRCSAAVAITDEATIRIFPSFGLIFGTQKLIGLRDERDTWTFVTEAKTTVVAAGAQLKLAVDIPAVGTSQTILVDVSGYLII